MAVLNLSMTRSESAVARPSPQGKMASPHTAGLGSLLLFMSNPAIAADCSTVASLHLPDVMITASAFNGTPVKHCKLDGVIGKAIKFSLWLPEDWNGKFVMGGQGGFAGSIDSQALPMEALQKGYATAGTDTGHFGNGIASDWAYGDMEAIVNYGHAAVHRVTVTSKYLIERHYKAPLSRSYFAGCSNGGRQGLMSAQRYPEDFDGVVAGAPAIDFTAITASFLNATRLNFPDPNNHATALISSAEREMIGAAALAACDAIDGIEDRIIADPDICKIDFGALACRGEDSDQCLSKTELAAIRSIHDGPKAQELQFGYGYPVGGEHLGLGWGAWLIGGKDAIAKGIPSLSYAYGVGFMRNFVMQDKEWSYQELDFADMSDRARLVQSTLSPTDPDLAAFRDRGGKLLMFHGWADSGLSPFMSIDYVDRVYQRDERSREDVRLFMLPGVLHCSGGPGPDRVDYLDALDAWVSTGTAPDELTAGFSNRSGARKLCAYPRKAHFLGGDGTSPEQFECR